MQSDAPNVTEYLKEAPEDRLETLKRLRDLCQEHLPDFDETMEYGMPSYSRERMDKPQIWFIYRQPYISRRGDGRW